MGNWLIVAIVAAVCLASAFIILYQQSATIGVWFQLRDIHHETFALAFLSLGVGVVIGAFIVWSDNKI